MGFQILDKQGRAISMHDLDREACALWKVEVDDRYYAAPSGDDAKLRAVLNWFDVIGWKIHYEKLTSWEAVKNSLKKDYFSNRKELGEGLEGVKYMLGHLQPLFDLIYHWRNKGYTPKPARG